MSDKAHFKIFQKLFLACFLLYLAGCVTHEPKGRIVRVEVPVLVPCKTQDVTVPSWASVGLKKSDSLEVKVRRRQRMGYERESVAAAAASR